MSVVTPVMILVAVVMYAVILVVLVMSYEELPLVVLPLERT